MPALTTILPSSRAIRSHLLQERESDGFLPNYLSIGEFFQRVVRVDGLQNVDEDTRTLLLLEAADFKNFENLKIERNFFTFTENATYLFRFFEELSGELVSIDALEMADTYGEYAEHIEILQELYGRYKQLCEQKQILERIFTPENYIFNSAYVKSLGAIEIHSLGYHTNFEIELLVKTSQLVPLKIAFRNNRFTEKMAQKFRDLGFELIDEAQQWLDFSTKEVSLINPLEENLNAHVASFSQPLLQIGFIKEQVYKMVHEEGINPEKIVVVLPNEAFSEQLRRFDVEENFNFAMGISLADSQFVEALQAVMDYLENSSVENSARIRRLGSELLEGIRPHYLASVCALDFSALMLPFLEKEQQREIKEVVSKSLYYFEKIISILGEASLKSALHLYMKRLKRESIDDVRGGKVTVMGLLESRLVKYDGVIVVDFNEGSVPRKSEKDLFLNTATRAHAQLPTTLEREALQKLYYHALFSQAKSLSIAYVSSADAVPSRFLSQLNIPLASGVSDSAYAPVVIATRAYEKVAAIEIEGHYDFTRQRLSATGLKAYLSCKRKFYYKYVAKLKNHEILKDMPKEHEIGSDIHKALELLYSEHDHFSDVQSLSSAFEKLLFEVSGKSEMHRYQNRLWMQRLKPFFQREIARFKEVRVKGCEMKLEREVCGITLHGVIDRIDQSVDGLEVLDYKSGSYKLYKTEKSLEGATDFQMEFYHLLASTLAPVSRIGFYDLKEGKIVAESLLQEKLERLYEHLQEMRETKEHVFEKTERLAECNYCEFVHLCERGLS